MPRVGFGAPLLLPLLALAVLAAGGFVWAWVRGRRAEQAYGGAAAPRLRARSYSGRRFWLKAALVITAVALLALAAARPQFGTHRTTLQREGTDVIIAFDVSLSMTATDVQPSRLDRAKAAISALLNHLGGDRIGLVTFAGDAQLRFPLTTDTEAAQQVVQSLSPKDGGLSAGTSIGAALRQTTDGFANDPTRSRVVVLVSDGEDLGDDAAGAAQFVSSEGIALYTIGVGTTTPTTLYTTDPRTGQVAPRIVNGQPETTTADPTALQQLAAANHGRFYNGNDDTFAPLLADEIGRLQKTPFESGQGDTPVEVFQWFAGIALALLLIEFLIPAGRGQPSLRRRRLAAAGRPPAAPERQLQAPVPAEQPAAAPTTGGD